MCGEGEHRGSSRCRHRRLRRSKQGVHVTALQQQGCRLQSRRNPNGVMNGDEAGTWNEPQVASPDERPNRLDRNAGGARNLGRREDIRWGSLKHVRQGDRGKRLASWRAPDQAGYLSIAAEVTSVASRRCPRPMPAGRIYVLIPSVNLNPSRSARTRTARNPAVSSAATMPPAVSYGPCPC